MYLQRALFDSLGKSSLRRSAESASTMTEHCLKPSGESSGGSLIGLFAVLPTRYSVSDLPKDWDPENAENGPSSLVVMTEMWREDDSGILGATRTWV